MGLYDFSFYDMIHRNSACFNNLPAWFEVDTGKTYSFENIKKRVDRLAGGLLKKGVNKGDRIGVIGKNSIEYFLLYGAAAAIGAIVLPINWRLSEKEVAFNLNDCTPVLLFADEELGKVVDSIKNNLPSVKEIFNLKGDQGGFSGFNQLMENSGEFSPSDIASDDGFVIIHTAAVEGRPRGALLSHMNIVCASLHLNDCFSLSPEDVHLNLLPLFHVGGLFMAANAFHAGAMNINFSRFDAEKTVALIEEKKASLMFDFSPILGSILDAQEKSGKDISSLRSVMGLDTPETIQRYQKITGGTFYAMFGQTETSCIATMGRFDDAPGSAGRPVSLGVVTLVDDHDNPVPTGQVGEITLKGPLVFKGYWNLDADNAYTFREGCHHTGDLGRFDENGYLWYAGRKAEKELIKPGGENVYPAEVEKAILSHPEVENTVVFGVPDPKWKEGIKAVCVLIKGSKLTEKELISFVGADIASYKKPQYVEFVSVLPENDEGVIDRAKVKELYGGEQG